MNSIPGRPQNRAKDDEDWSGVDILPHKDHTWTHVPESLTLNLTSSVEESDGHGTRSRDGRGRVTGYRTRHYRVTPTDVEGDTPPRVRPKRHPEDVRPT